MAKDSIAINKQKKRFNIGMFFVMPSAIIVLVMTVYPLVQMIVFSFSKVKLPFFELDYVGLENFVKAVTSSSFGTIVKNTLVWTLVSLALRFLIGFIAALLMDTGFRGKTVFRVITLIPWVVPSIVAANLWRWIYNMDNGILNYIIRNINPDWAVNWLGTQQTALLSVVIAYVWMGFPFIMLMIVAAMQGIPKSLTEAAAVDGANAAQVLLHITLPSIRRILGILFVLEIINGFNTFDLLFTMTGGGPGTASETLGLFIYRTAFTNFNFGRASAIGLMLLMVVMICFAFYAPFQRKGKNNRG